ncbi:PLP-dependent cysteine synthase family protein [Adhaeribacter radiodurans]|uniref:cysteine synthase n=1 Tax=Adhaeribacter radiodurans TaxID=2745197 RepID=A0A7L7L8B3_9BACT|nr:cysteine synthase family protein [Adhaeribacter radiodurans]QMU29047.1 cysteine synthase family protein [Adhaeribacter radiodurans]
MHVLPIGYQSFPYSEDNFLLTETALTPAVQKKFERLWYLVGNTPMLELFYTFEGQPRSLYVKCEQYNLTGSMKDRMALYVLQQAYREGKIRPGDRIVEATSGSTGIAFSAIGRALGHPVTIIMPEGVSQERIAIIRSLGAEVVLFTKAEGGFMGAIQRSEEMAACDPRIFLPRQFANRDNTEAHRLTTGKEIWLQLQSVDVIPDAFVAGVGTGGTVMGVGRYLKSRNVDVQIHPVEPAESPTLSVGYKTGTHRIQGLFDEFVPGILKLNELDQVLQASDGDAILMAQKLARELGIAVGISSGANLVGAIKLQQEMGPDAHVVTVLCDCNKKYLSTDLVRNERVKSTYIAPKVIFKDYRPISRL